MPRFPTPPSPQPQPPRPGDLLNAVISNNHMLVRRLLDQKADINEKDGNNNTPLNLAAELGRTDIVRTLLEKGADINAKNKDGNTPLMSAIASFPAYNYNRDSISISQMLISKGADTTVKNKNGDTAMSLAVKRSKTSIVSLLKDEEVRRKKLAEEFAKAREKKRHEAVIDKQQDLRDASKNKPRLKPPRPPKAA